jgi:hypothetical protein
MVCSPAARAEGVARHQRQREAQARCPQLTLADHDPAANARMLEPIAAPAGSTPNGMSTIRAGRWGIDKVLGEEPDLQLVAAQYVAHEQVVGAVVAVGCGGGDRVAHATDGPLVGFEEPRQHRRHLLGSVRRPGDRRHFGDVAGSAMAMPPRVWTRSAIMSMSSVCSPACLSSSRCSW